MTKGEIDTILQTVIEEQLASSKAEIGVLDHTCGRIGAAFIRYHNGEKWNGFTFTQECIQDLSLFMSDLLGWHGRKCLSCSGELTPKSLAAFHRVTYAKLALLLTPLIES